MRGNHSLRTREAVARALGIVIGVLTVVSALAAAAVTARVAAEDRSCIDVQDAAARGTEGAREPDMGAAEEVPSEHAGQGGGDFRASVPTHVHVVSPDGVEAMVPESKVREQVRVLTLGFGGHYGGADTGFGFRLESVDYSVNADWYYAGPSSKGERDMKRALHEGGPDALNLYLTTAGPYLGWSYFPSVVAQPGQAYLDGVVVDWRSLPGIGYYEAYDLGFTAVHEVGHWLNLYHTFQGGCNRWGDYVDDTPPQRTPTFGCPDGKDTCSDAGLDPIHNYMDYSDDPCYSEFTAGQAERMQDAWRYWRA